ncbi:MAG: hypothetical protein CMJ18_03670 [Phycisphaeraceae bacterium]|nr:hypothetical protein [Phycisphaeraceae bacterium]
MGTLIAGLVLSLTVMTGQAGAVTISDSLAAISTASAEVAGTSITSWISNGTEHHGLGASYWYRVGDSGPEALVSSLPLIGGPTVSGNTFNASYGNADFTIDFEVMVSSAGNISTLPVTLDVTSHSDNLELHLFEVHDLDLTTSTLGDVLGFVPIGPPPAPPQPNDIVQTDGFSTFSGNSEVLGGSPNVFPSHWQLDTAAALSALMADGSATTLADTPADSSTTVGPDAAFAFQWDTAPLAANDSFQLIIRKQLDGALIPEPVTGFLGLLSIAALGSCVTARRRTVA